MSILSERLRMLRGESSQSEMAKCLDMPRQQWIKYETGQSAPGAEILAKICRVHACSADWLLGLKDFGSSVNVRGDGNVIAQGNGAVASVSKSVQADCKACAYKKAIAKLQKAGLQIPGL